jgi:hypothetical protein
VGKYNRTNYCLTCGMFAGSLFMLARPGLLCAAMCCSTGACAHAVTLFLLAAEFV